MVPKIKKILFISDLSKSSRNAFYYAASIASFYKADIDVFHAMEDIQESMKTYIFSFLGEELWEKYEEDKKNHARSLLISKKNDSTMVQKALEILSEDSKERLQEQKTLVNQIIVKNQETDITNEIHYQCEKENYDLIVASYKCFISLTGIRAGARIKKTIKSNNIPLLLVPVLEEEWEEGEE